MSKIPEKPEDIFDEFRGNYNALFGDDLLSIILYGSGARGEYIAKKSDINFLIVLNDNGMERLNDSMDLTAKWEKRRVPVPLFLSEDYIKSSLDAFPLEFFNIRLAYSVVYGQDVLKDLNIEKGNLRLQCERELKAKLLLLRRSFLQANGEVRLLTGLVKQSFSAFISIFNALLYLKGDEIPGEYLGIIKAMSENYDINRDLFQNLSQIKKEEKKFAKDEIKKIVWEYILEIKGLSKKVDQMVTSL
jgi:predicted nucleotidyltransferase